VIIHLDTNIASGLIRTRKPLFRKKLLEAQNQGHDIFISIIVYYELLYGALNSSIPEKRCEALADFVFSISGVIEFKDEDATAAAKLRAYFRPLGTGIGPYDFLIAAQALAKNAKLVTENIDEFRRVPNLELLRWTR
jgi:tRNA(fMet)-specific endonuclease VapC